MNIKLTHTAPKKTGYYLVQCEPNSTIHLVLIVISEGCKMQIFNESNKELFYHQFPAHFTWSDIINYSYE